MIRYDSRHPNSAHVKQKKLQCSIDFTSISTIKY